MPNSPYYIALYPYSSIGQGTWTYGQVDSYYRNYGVDNQAARANGDNISWKTEIGADGNYKLLFHTYRSTDYGIADFSFNGVEKFSVDCYAGAGAIYTYRSAEFALSSGIQDLKITVHGKNAASTNYQLAILSLALYRSS